MYSAARRATVIAFALLLTGSVLAMPRDAAADAHQFCRANMNLVLWPFDIVLFLGVLYHERHPLLALEHLARLTRECALVETHYSKSSRQPLLHFYPGSSLNDDPTNFWGPTLSCIDLMLREVGFREVSLVKRYRDNGARAIFLAQK